MVKLEIFDGFKTWGKGNNESVEMNIFNHYEKHVKSENENWDKFLKIGSLEEYRDFAIEKSKVMTNKIVHTNGHRVYVSGLYENVLIIGRLDENNQLGISSCYIIHDHLFEKKMQVFLKNQCFNF